MYVDAVFTVAGLLVTVAGPLYYSGRSGRSGCRSGVGGQIRLFNLGGSSASRG
jgi:hypothetical protein